MWAHFQEILLMPAWLSVTEPAGWVCTEPLSSRIHPSYLNALPQRAASRASTITTFHLQQLKLNLSLSPFIAFLRLSLSVPFPVWPQVSAVVFAAFLSFPSCLSLALVTSSLLSPSLRSRAWLRPLPGPRQKHQATWLVGRPKDAPILGQKEAGPQLRRAAKRFMTVLSFSASLRFLQHCLHLKIIMWFH